MNCRDFERVLQERLDTPADITRAQEAELEQHRSTCASCSASAARFQVLAQAIRSWGPVPQPSAQLLERIVEAAGREEFVRPRVLSIRRIAAGLAIAAGILIAIFFKLPWSPTEVEPASTGVVATGVPAAIDPSALSDALVLAGSATWDLARETGAPAARVGRGVLESATFAEEARPAPSSVPPSPALDVLQSVGDRVNAGVRPFSGTARRAFGFLFDSPPGDVPTEARTSSGA